MVSITKIVLRGSTAILGVAAASAAFAQTAVPSTAAPSGSAQVGRATDAPGGTGVAQGPGNQPAEIVITAQRTAGLASKTPVALSVFSGQALREQGVNSVSDIKNLAPSIEIGSAAHGPQIAIRGISSTDQTSKGEQGVSFNIDNIPIGRPQIMGLAFFDLERVEVLRGPQGTLYGRSSTGGAINLITAKPKEDLEGAASIELGNFATRRVDAMVNLPITDNLAIRAAGNLNMRDGYLKPVLGADPVPPQRRLNDEDNRTGRLSALYKLGDLGTIVATYTIGHIGGTGGTNAVLYDRVNGTGTKAREVFYNPMAGVLDDNFHVYNGEVNLNLGAVHFAYDGAHVYFHGHDNYDPQDWDPYAGPGQPSYGWRDYRSKVTTDSHEIRFSNSNPSRLEWVAGANYWKEVIDEQDLNWQTLIGRTATPDPTVFITCTPPTYAAYCNLPNPHIVGVTQHKSVGVFGQATFHLTDRFKLIGGLRWSHDSMFREATIASGQPPATGWLNASGQPCAPFDACVGTQPDNGAQKASKVTWRAGVEFDPTSTQILYASIATGYKAGSFNDVDPTRPGGGAGTYGPEQLTAYEVGYKGRILPSVQFNSAVYYYDYSKYQLTGGTFLTPSVTGGSPIVLIYTKLVPAKLYGWENEINWTVSPADRLNLTASFQEGHFTGGTVGFLYLNPIDWSGKRLDNLPKFTLIGSYEHRFTLGSGATISAQARSKYSSGYLESDLAGTGDPFANTYSVLPAQYKQKSFTRSDVNIIYTAPSGKYSVEAYVRNIEDRMQLLGAPQNIKQGVSTNGANPADYVSVRASDPRTYGVRFSARF